MDAFHAYAALRAKGRHIEPKPGDRLPLKGVEAMVVSTEGATIEETSRRRRRTQCGVCRIRAGRAGAA